MQANIENPGTPPGETSEPKLSVEQPPSRRMWVPWLLFFFQFLAVGAYFIYLNVFYRQAGLSGTQIGIISMSSSIIGVVSAVGWGYLSDRTGKPRLLIAGGAMGAVIVAQFYPLVHTFWAFFGLSCLASVMASALGTLVDGVTLAMLGSKSENYGRYRLGGSIGYILAASTTGFIYDRTGLSLIFPIYGVMMGLFALTALLLPDIPVRLEKRAAAQIGEMMRQSVWLVFSASIFLIWVANYGSIMYQGVVLLSMGASQSLIGMSMIPGALIEIPFLAFSGALIRRAGLVPLLLVAMVLMVIRYFLLWLMPKPEWALLINMINGPAYGLLATTSVAYAKKLAPPSLNATAQGLLNSTINLAGVVSALVMGMLFDQIGAQGIFLVMAFCCLAALGLFGASYWGQRAKPAVEET
jgi:PPP family 3-phenylpropionic acid transporter